MARIAGNVAASRFAHLYGLALFFALAYLFSWSLWSLEGRVENGGLVVWLGSAGPALAAALVVTLNRGRQGLEELLSRLLVWRVGVKWYLIALFLVPLVGLGIAAGYALAGNLTAELPGAEVWRDTLGLQLVGHRVGGSARHPDLRGRGAGLARPAAVVPTTAHQRCQP